jgi:hypothetical protein
MRNEDIMDKRPWFSYMFNFENYLKHFYEILYWVSMTKDIGKFTVILY